MPSDFCLQYRGSSFEQGDADRAAQFALSATFLGKAGDIRLMDPMVCAASIYGGPIRLIHLRLDGLIDKPVTESLQDVWSCAWRSVAT